MPYYCNESEHLEVGDPMMTQCNRKGCVKSVDSSRSRGIPKKYCSDKCRIDVAHGRAEQGLDRHCGRPDPPKTSWWQHGETFYETARKLFPEEPKMVTNGWGDHAA